MHAAAINLRGGVAPETTRFRRQSIIEYVLNIAVIGLVIVFAGPGVAGAIRNQFNLVGNTLNSGTNGGMEGGGEALGDAPEMWVGRGPLRQTVLILAAASEGPGCGRSESYRSVQGWSRY